MAEGRVERRLAAVLAADVAGYSRLMGADEEGTHAALTALRRELSDPKIAEHRGRIVKTTGDGLLVEFASVVDAVRCAVELQREMALRNDGVAMERRINLGDIIIDEQDIYGDGVNVAARLEALAEPGGICVSRVVRDQVRDKVDFGFEDLGEQQVKNIVRPVRVYRIPLAETARTKAPLPLPDKPSLAVLPFQNMTGDAEQDYFVDGIVEEITTAISRLSWLFVIARNSSFTYKGRAAGVKQVARELGVRYVLEGRVRKAGNRLRITGQLIDTATGAHIWADRFDGAVDDIFELQDEVASSVVGVIEPKLRQSEIERAIRKPTESLDAYDLYLRAIRARVQDHLRGRERGHCPAEARAGNRPVLCAGRGEGRFVPRRPSIIGPGQGFGRGDVRSRATGSTGDRNGQGRSQCSVDGCPRPFIFARAHGTAASAVDRALTLNPNSAHAWMTSGRVSCFRNRPEPAIEAFRRAMRLSPLDPQTYQFTGGIALGASACGAIHRSCRMGEPVAGRKPALYRHAPLQTRRLRASRSDRGGA
jgi:TolB-like protein/class 3 adenylate cyclase